MGRAPCCDKANVKKGPWSPEEDAKLKAYIEQYGTGGNWIALPQKIGLKRCGKSCRLRWLNYLRPNIKHGGFSEEEDNIICSLYISIGSRWSIIAAQLPGRTDNDIKNYWNTRLKKKLMGKQQREQQALARRIHSLKQETVLKKDQDHKTNFNILPSVISTNNQAQTPYYPEPVTSVQITSSSGPGEDLRDLFFKMGGLGRFSESTTACTTPYHLNPVEISISQTQNNPFFENSSNLIQFPDMQFDMPAAAAVFNGAENGNPLQDLDHGLEGYYGMENMMMATAGSVGSNSAESSSLGEMSSMVYHDYEGIPQNVVSFEESIRQYCLQ